MPNKKTFVYVEGRENIPTFMADDFKRATLAYGWNYRQLYYINPSDILDDNKMHQVFPPNCAVILRNLPKNSTVEVAMLAHWLNEHQVVTLNFNATGGLEASNDKQFQQLILKLDKKTSEYIIPTYEVHNKAEVLKLVSNKVIQYPFLLKPRDGSIGKGIKIIQKASDLASQKRWNGMMAQRFIDSEYDWRVYTVGNKAIGALRRSGKDQKPYDFHAYANGIQKDKETDPKILTKINQIALAAAAVTNLEYSGCDIIREKDTGKYFILEVNTAATWEGKYNEIIEVDIATEILKWCDKRITSSKRLGN